MATVVSSQQLFSATVLVELCTNFTNSCLSTIKACNSSRVFKYRLIFLMIARNRNHKPGSLFVITLIKQPQTDVLYLGLSTCRAWPTGVEPPSTRTWFPTTIPSSWPSGTRCAKVLPLVARSCPTPWAGTTPQLPRLSRWKATPPSTSSEQARLWYFFK